MISKKIVSLVTVFSLTFGMAIQPKVSYAEEDTTLEVVQEEKVNIVDVLSFNDLHGNVIESGKNIGAAKLAGVINEYKAQESDSYGVIPVSAGDLFQGTAISNLTKGAPVIDMIKLLGIKLSAVGNHEFDWQRSDFSTWQTEGEFDFLAANIIYKDTKEIVDFVKPYEIVEKNGVKIGFIGIATTDTLTSTKAENVEDLEFLDPVETLDEWSEVVRNEGADVIIALTHAGASEAEDGTITGEAADIAKNAKDVDAVIAAHNHAFVDGYVGDVPVVQAGYNGRGLSRLRFTFDENNELVEVEPYTQKFQGLESTLPVDEEVQAIVDKYNAELEPIFAEVVTPLENTLDHDRNNGLTPLGVVVSDAMRNITGTQISINNGGGIRRPLEAGNITIGDMYEILPFDNTIVTLEVTGSELVKLIEHGINPDGFGWGQFAGIKVWYDEVSGNVSSIRLLDGTKVEMDKYYSVAINDFMLTGGDGYDFSNAINVVNTQIVMRESIQEYWRENGVPSLDLNLLIAGEDTTVEETPENIPEEEIKPEIKPEVKPEEEIKPEVNPEEDSDIKEDITNNDIENTEDKEEDNNKTDVLPQTGDIFGTTQILLMSAGIIATGGVLLKKKKDNVA